MTLRPPFIVLFLVFVVLGVYYPSIFAPFNSVDDLTLVNMLINQERHDLVRLFFPQGSGYYYRPLLILTFWLDQWLWGLHESFMHLGNILLHVMNSLLVYAIVKRLTSTTRHAAVVSAFAALLFALHPLNSEAVNWISGRTDLLAGLFILSATWLLLSVRGEGYLFHLLAACSLLIACLAKETAIFFLPAALFMVYCRERDENGAAASRPLSRANLFAATSFLFAAVAYFVIRSLALSKGDVGVRHAAGQIAEKGDDYLYLVRTVLKVGGFYLKKIFYPWPLNFGIIKVPDHYLYLGVVLLLLLAWLLYRRNLVASFFVAAICVGSSALLVAFGRMAWTPIAERYMYIPSAFAVIGITLFTSSLTHRIRLSGQFYTIAAILLLSVFALSTTLRNMTWQDNLALFSDTVEKSPDFLPARNDKAIALITKGKKEEGYRIIKGLDAPESLNNWEIAVLNNARVLLAERKIDEARALVMPLAEKNGRNQVRAIELLLQVDEKLLKESGRSDRGEIGREVVSLLETLQKKTGNPFYHYRLGQAHLSMKSLEEARKAFERAYEKAPLTAYYREPAGKLARSLADKDRTR